MSQRISTERLARIATELTARDRVIVDALGRVKLATGNQLRRIAFEHDDDSTRRTARRELARLLRWRVVERLERRLGGIGSGSESWTYALGVAGQRLIGCTRGRRPHLPRPAMWAHALAGAETYTCLVEATRGTDRRIRRWQGEPDCWRAYGGSYAEALLLKPDAFAAVSGSGYEDLCFVEIDTGSQSRTVIRAKLAAYRRYAATGQEQATQDGVFPLTVFVTTSAERHAVLVDLIGELPSEAWRMFAVGLIEDASRLLLGGAS